VHLVEPGTNVFVNDFANILWRFLIQTTAVLTAEKV
jgi:hypothetical protein